MPYFNHLKIKVEKNGSGKFKTEDTVMFFAFYEFKYWKQFLELLGKA
jgi:hypothetical protein